MSAAEALKVICRSIWFRFFFLGMGIPGTNKCREVHSSAELNETQNGPMGEISQWHGWLYLVWRFAKWARQLKFYGHCTNRKRRRRIRLWRLKKVAHELDQAGKWRAAARNVIKCRLNYKQIKFTTPTSGRARCCCHDGSKNEWDLHSSERPRVDCARARPGDWRLVKLWYFVPKAWSGKKIACEKFKELDFLTPEMSILCRNSRSISILSSSSPRWMGTGILMENQCCIINTCVC